MILPRVVAATIVVLALLPTGCHARQRMLDAVVKQSGDLPCFSVPRFGWRATELEVTALVVTEVTREGAVISQPWGVGLSTPLREVTVSSRSCLVYGAVPGEHAAPLRRGARYSLFLNTFTPDGVNRRYRAYFCLGADEDRDKVVRQVKWDQHAHKRRWDVCGLDS